MNTKRYQVTLQPNPQASALVRKLAVKQKMKVKNLHAMDGSIHFETDRQGIRLIRRHRRSFRLKVRVSQIGSNTVFHRLFASYLFLLSCLIPLCASFFLWKVEVKSEIPELEERLGETLEKANIQLFRPLRMLPDEGKMRELLMQAEPTLSWVRFKKLGTSLTVYPMLAPLSESNEEPKSEKASHLVAKTGGVITHFALTSGERVAIVHQTVKKGDLLATGILEQGDKTTVVGADGAVFADYWLEYQFELPRTVEYAVQGDEHVDVKWQVPWKQTKDGNFHFQKPLEIEQSRNEVHQKVFLKKGMEKTVILPLLKYNILSKKTTDFIIKEENILHVSFDNDKVSGTILFLVNDNIAIKRPITQGD